MLQAAYLLNLTFNKRGIKMNFIEFEQALNMLIEMIKKESKINENDKKICNEHKKELMEKEWDEFVRSFKKCVPTKSAIHVRFFDNEFTIGIDSNFGIYLKKDGEIQGVYNTTNEMLAKLKEIYFKGP